MIWDEHTHLMIDLKLDAEVENLSMVREEAWKHEGNPIIDESHEPLFGNEKGYRIWALCICRHEGVYRMWYRFQPDSVRKKSHRERLENPKFQSFIYYAESEDGIHFRPVQIPSASGNGIDMTVEGVPGTSVSDILHDPLDREYPFKCVYYRPGKGRDVYRPRQARWPGDPNEDVRLVWGIGRSKDGLSWEPPKHDHFLVPAQPESAKLHRSMDGDWLSQTRACPWPSGATGESGASSRTTTKRPS